MAVTLEQIKELRNRTGVGVSAVKQALDEANGDSEKAIELLRKQGIAKGAKRAGRSTDNGFIASYIHGGGRIGVMVEIGSETDFASRSEDFQTFANDIAMHIAASKPIYVSSSDVPDEVKESEIELIKEQLEGKDEKVAEKIKEGRLQKYYEEFVLLEQPFVKDEKKKVKDLLAEMLAKVGEKIEIERFARFEIAEVPSAFGVDK
jgi:elongation factor Ts